MRIISGYAAGRRLVTPNNRHVRPTTDRIKEALFSILGDMTDTIIVDGCAGSGALGCESLSRGAQYCYFFDNARSSIELVKQNVEIIDAQSSSFIKKCPVTRGLELLTHDPDVIFLDPPYGSTDLIERAFDVIAASSTITDGALVVLEQDIDDTQLAPDGFDQEDERVYGRTRLSFLRKTSSAPATA